jgi:hypothetical protein
VGPVIDAAIDPNNRNVAYVVFGGFGTPASPRKHVWKVSNLEQLTTGGAVGFDAFSSGLPDLPVNSIAIDPQSGSASRSSTDIYVGTDIGVYKSSDAGATWTAYGTGFPRVAVFGLAVQNPNRILRAATHGRGFYETTVSASAPAGPALSAAYSRKSHGTAGVFDVDLPLTGTLGVEPRRGGPSSTAPGDFIIVARFTNAVTAGSAAVTGGTGSVSGTPIFSGNDMIINLTGVTNVQTLTLTLTSVTDSNGMTLASVAIPIGFDIGDTSGDKTVNAGDVTQVKNNSGKIVDAATFRTDVTTDGIINSGDVIVTKNKSGSTIP